PPDVANHWNTAQMFPGFSHTRRVPCTQKPSSRATLTLNSFRVRSFAFLLETSSALCGSQGVDHLHGPGTEHRVALEAGGRAQCGRQGGFPRPTPPTKMRVAVSLIHLRGQ